MRVTSPPCRNHNSSISDDQPSTSRSEQSQASPTTEKVKHDSRTKPDTLDLPRLISRSHHALRSCDDLSKRHCDVEESCDESVNTNSEDGGTESDVSSSDREDCDQLSPVSLPDKPQV